MTPQEFAHLIAKPNLNEALKNINDMQRVFNACAGIEGLASHLFHYLLESGVDHWPDSEDPKVKAVPLPDRESDGKFKGFLSKRNEQFKIVHDIAEAQKHAVLTRGIRTVMSSSELISKEHGFDYTRWDELVWDAGEAICVQVAGERRVVVALALHALKFLEDEIYMAEAEAETRRPKTLDEFWQSLNLGN